MTTPQNHPAPQEHGATPGPWRVDPYHKLCVESADGNICLVNLVRASEADARLIAASPAYYAAAERALDAMKDAKRLIADFRSQEDKEDVSHAYLSQYILRLERAIQALARAHAAAKGTI